MPARYDLIVSNGTVVAGQGRAPLDIGIVGGSIAAIAPSGALDGTGRESLDASELFVLPGVIDAHVHFREPGLEHKEDWLTGSRAAVHGGVTTVLDMPNTVPPTRSIDGVRAKVALAAAKSYCDFGLFGLVDDAGSGSLAELVESGLVVGLKVFLGPTTGDLAAPPDDRLLRALELAREAGLRTAFHAEDKATLSRTQAAVTRRRDVLAHLQARPAEAEVAAIDHVGRLLHAAGAAGHILHLSSAKGLAAVRRWRARGVDLSCEVTPHHIFLGLADYERLGAAMKVNPPVRGEPDASALLAALCDGTIDCVASDHAPHAPLEKSTADIRSAAAGVAGVETMLPLLLTAVARGELTLERLAAATSEAPARAWGLWPRKGAIAVGSDADLSVVDMRVERTIRGSDLHAKHPLTPFEGRPTRGAAVATIVRGRVVMQGGRLRAVPGCGRSVRTVA
ncbi:MAG: dihydroorotase family protein [Chloroflexota bacterium]|nr:dihydroorotase family protein [Chloroflexota bacterium]